MPTFIARLTNQGLALYNGAVASGVPVQLTSMGVGDGNGNPVTPSPAQTALVREVYRGYLSGLDIDETDPTLFFAELVIPPNVGNFAIREVGIFTVDGTLFAVANFPDTYKPVEADGSTRDLAIHFGIKLSNSAAITLVVDVNIVTATRAWVISTVTPALLLPGGLTNQVLAKESNADGDFVWVDLGEINVTVDTIEEPQTLAAGQTLVTMAITSTRGLAVYIEGVRLRRGAGVDDWQIADGGTSLTQIVLGKSYPNGSRITTTQNEPAGAQRAPLEQLENLADIPNKPLARQNLDVYSREESFQRTPAGAILHFGQLNAPTGWLKANGAAVNRITYAALFASIGTTFGVGDGVLTFNLPDLRGEFVRGFDDGRGVDPSRFLGSPQSSQNLAHSHTSVIAGVADHNHTTGIYTRLLRPPYVGSLTGYDTNDSGVEQAVGVGDSIDMSPAGAHTHTITINDAGGTEARPRNIALLACIKH